MGAATSISEKTRQNGLRNETQNETIGVGQEHMDSRMSPRTRAVTLTMKTSMNIVRVRTIATMNSRSPMIQHTRPECKS